MSTKESQNPPQWRRKVLVLEDESLIAALIAQMLSDRGFEADFCLDAVTAKTLVERLDPDAVLIDVNLGAGPNGLQFGEWLHKAHPEIAQVYLTATTDPRIWGDFNSAKSRRWLAKSVFIAKSKLSDPLALVACINSALSDRTGLAPLDLRVDELLRGLTNAELEVLRLAAEGLTNSAIAARRGTTMRTVEQQFQGIYQGLNLEQSDEVNLRVQAVRAYLRAAGAT
jgi:DNA-binding NarL/FixJ family response regulator